ncbi:hypothetical protein BGZ95_006161, partial [Linnemannia exigua]
IFTNKTEYVPVENLRNIDISKVAQAASHQPTAATSGLTGAAVTETTTTKPVDHKESIVDRVKDVFHHDSSAPATVHHKTEHAPTVVEKHREPIVASTTATATHTAKKESLVDHVKDVFHRDTPETHATSTKTAAPVTVAAAAGTAAGVAARLHDKDTDNTTTPPKVHDHRAYLAPGVKSSITTTTTGTEHATAAALAAPVAAVDPSEFKSHVFKPVDASPLKKQTPTPAPVFDTKYMDTSATAPAITAATTALPVTAHAPVVPAAHTTTSHTTVTPVVHTTTSHAPVVPIVQTTTTTTKPANEIQFTDPTTLRPLTGTRTWEIPPAADHRSITTKIKDAIGLHTASEYGPADPKDLPLSDPKTLRLVKDIAPMAAVATTAAATAAAAAPMVSKSTTTTNTPVAPVVPVVHTTTTTPAVTAKSVNGIQFTDPTTLRPLTGTRTWEIPPVADHRTITTKIKDAIGIHAASEYGPADPKDLPLSDPKTLRLVKDIAPVAAVASTAAAVAPMLNKSHATTTTATKEEHNPVSAAPRPVIPATSSVSKTEVNPVHTAPHPVIPATSAISKTESHAVQMAPRPVIPTTTHVDSLSSHAVKDAPHPIIPPVVTNEKTHHHQMESNPVLTAPRPVIPVTEQTTTTTTSHHADSAPKLAHAAVPIVAAAAAVPLVEKSRTSTTTTSYDKPNVVESAPRSVIPVVTSAPIVQQQQQQQYQQTQQPTSYTTTTNTYNNAPIQQQQVNAQHRASAAEVNVADKIAAAIPESYHGPIPNLQPGEEIVWVKTVTTTDYYDDNSPPVVTHVNNTVAGPGGNVNPALGGVPANAVHDNSTQRRSGGGGFLDRLTHRHHDNVDKGKQRM